MTQPTNNQPHPDVELREILYNVANFYSGRQFTLDGGDYEGVEKALEAILKHFVPKEEPKTMPKHRRRALTQQERSFEAEVGSFVRAYPDMTLKEYWIGRWHQKSQLGAAQLTNNQPNTPKGEGE